MKRSSTRHTSTFNSRIYSCLAYDLGKPQALFIQLNKIKADLHFSKTDQYKIAEKTKRKTSFGMEKNESNIDLISKG